MHKNKFLRRLPAPRVHITYDVEAGGEIEKRDLPFVIGVLADVSGERNKPPEPVVKRKFVEVDRDNIDSVVRKIGPRLAFEVPNLMSAGDTNLMVELRFENIEDFGPVRIAQQIAPLRSLLELRASLANVRELLADAASGADIARRATISGEHSSPTKSQGRKRLASGQSLLDQIMEEGGFGQTPEARNSGKMWLTAFARDVLDQQISVSEDTEATINVRLSELDSLISRQLNAVLHCTPLQKLEASWRGLHYLVQQTETSSRVKIKLLDITKEELFEDMQKAIDFDRSQIFKKVFDEELGTVGGTPFGALIGDYEFGCAPDDVSLLEKMASVAATAHTPFIAGAAPSMFNFKDFTELAAPRDLEKIVNSETYFKWNMFRRSENARYVGLCVPHVLMRLPYGKDTVPVEEFDFEEGVDGKDHSKYLWGSAAYAFAARLTDAFGKFEWCAAVRGVEGGGLVEGLPVDTFITDEGDVAAGCPTEVAITDRRENELAKLGFIPLCYYKGTGAAVFMGAQSTQKPKLYLDSDANANSRLAVQLQYTLACSRFAHYLQVMMRDKISSFMSRDQFEVTLNRWISNYVLLDDLATVELKAKFPLREARVEVKEDAARHGAYTAILFVRPHFQLEALAVSLRLTIRLLDPRV